MAPLVPEVPTSGSGAGVPEAQELLASQAMVTTSPPPPSAALLSPGSYGSTDVLERALFVMALLREGLQSTDSRLVAGHLGLVFSWLHSDVSVRATLSRAATDSEKDKETVSQAVAAREVALKDAKAAQDRCRLLAAELETVRRERAKEA